MTTPAKITELTGEWILDPARSTVSLATRSMGGLARVNGSFGQVTGAASISPAGAVTGTLTVAAASIDTKNSKRDKHLRSADFLDCGNYPGITCTVDSVRPPGPGIQAAGQATAVTAATSVTVSGRLSIRGNTRPLTFAATATTHHDGQIWLDAEVRVNRADFGITWNMLGMTSMHNTITVHAVFGRIPA